MTKSHAGARNATTMVRYISQFIQNDLKEYKLGLVTVTEGIMNKDNTLLKIFVSFFDEENRDKLLAELNRHKPYIRSLLAAKMTTYKVPELVFALDDTAIRARWLEEALKREKEFFGKK